VSKSYHRKKKGRVVKNAGPPPTTKVGNEPSVGGKEALLIIDARPEKTVRAETQYIKQK